MEQQTQILNTLHDTDIRKLHFILYAGSWPLPEFLTDVAESMTDYAECFEATRMFEIARLNRLKKTGWVSVEEKRIWLTKAGLEAAFWWLDYSAAESVKRQIKKDYQLPLLKHRIPWLQRNSFYLRNEPMKTPLARWFDPMLPIRN